VIRPTLFPAPTYVRTVHTSQNHTKTHIPIQSVICDVKAGHKLRFLMKSLVRILEEVA